MQLDTLVKWQQGPLTLTGRIVHNGGNMATVRANGNTYEVKASALRPIWVCPGCDKPFKRRRSDQVYCSDRCRQKARNMRRAVEEEPATPHHCRQCGAEIGGVNRSRKQFCSVECYKSSRRKNKCAACGQPTRKLNATYCRACSDALDRQNTDNLIFAAIVEYKRQHDGCTPTARQLAKAAFCVKETAQAALLRLAASGRIRFQGNGAYRQILVSGARWVYEEPST